MTVSLRNKSGEVLHLGRPDGPRVEADEIVKVDGKVTETDDAYVIGEGDDARAYPKSTWVDASPVKKNEAKA